MNNNEQCLRCGSTHTLPDARVQEYSSRKITVAFDTKPEAALFRGTQRRELKARICGECGHTELYVEDARELWIMHQQNQQR
jgi:predicted nucleic-acid-binding Zn-ribbon protein